MDRWIDTQKGFKLIARHRPVADPGIEPISPGETRIIK